MQQDYSKQLDAIIGALNRSTPWWQPWIPFLAAILAVMGGFVGQILLIHVAHWRKLRIMRKLVYKELGEVLVFIDTTLSLHASEPVMQSEHLQRKHIKMAAVRMSDDFMKANLDVYADLTEKPRWDIVHSCYQELLAQPKDLNGHLKVVAQMIAQQFGPRRLNIKRYRKYQGKQDATKIEALLAKYRLSDT